MKAGSIALISTSFLTTALAIASLIVLFVPFPTRTLTDKTQNQSSSSQNEYTIFGFTITRRDEVQVITPTSVSQIITEINTPLATNVHINYNHNQRPTPVTTQARPTRLPAALEERQFTGFTGDHFTFSHSNPGFGAGSPFNPESPLGKNSLTISQARPAGGAQILLLVAYILLILESLAVGIHFIVKSNSVQSGRPEFVLPLAIFHFVLLILLAIVLLIALALLLHAVDLFHRAEGSLGSSFIGRSQFFKYYFGNSNSFSYLAGPVVVLLVLGWLLLVSTVASAVLVLLHRERARPAAIADKEEIIDG